MALTGRVAGEPPCTASNADRADAARPQIARLPCSVTTTRQDAAAPTGAAAAGTGAVPGDPLRRSARAARSRRPRSSIEALTRAIDSCTRLTPWPRVSSAGRDPRCSHTATSCLPRTTTRALASAPEAGAAAGTARTKLRDVADCGAGADEVAKVPPTAQWTSGGPDTVAAGDKGPGAAVVVGAAAPAGAATAGPGTVPAPGAAAPAGAATAGPGAAPESTTSSARRTQRLAARRAPPCCARSSCATCDRFATSRAKLTRCPRVVSAGSGANVTRGCGGAPSSTSRIATSSPLRTTTNAPANPQTRKPANPQTRKPANPQTRKPANPQTRKPANPQTRKPALEGEHTTHYSSFSALLLCLLKNLRENFKKNEGKIE